MNKVLIIILSFIPWIASLNAQSNYKIIGGINYSSFRDVEDSEPEPGFALGIGKEWAIYKKIAIEGQILYSAKKATLKNKKIIYYPGIIYLKDIQWKMGFIEIPVFVKYKFPFFKSSLSINLGPSFLIAVKDNSKIKRIETVCIKEFQENNKKCTNYDYHSIEDPGPIWAYTLGSSGIGLNFGTGIKWSNFTIEWCYYVAFHSIYTANLVELDETFHSLILLLSVSL